MRLNKLEPLTDGNRRGSMGYNNMKKTYTISAIESKKTPRLNQATCSIGHRNEIVTIQRREAITTSLRIAEVFGKRHDAVLRSIQTLDCSESFTHRNFVASDYKDSTGRTLPMFTITRDGFSFLAMGYTGKRAARFKEQFIDAFNHMEKALLQRHNLEWQHARDESKLARRVETDTISRFVDYATSQGSSKAQLYYCNITKMTYKALALVKEASTGNFREMLDAMHLSFLSTAEYIVQRGLEEGMESGLHYRDIYGLARDRIVRYAESIPRQCRLIPT